MSRMAPTSRYDSSSKWCMARISRLSFLSCWTAQTIRSRCSCLIKASLGLVGGADQAQAELDRRTFGPGNLAPDCPAGCVGIAPGRDDGVEHDAVEPGVGGHHRGIVTGPPVPARRNASARISSGSTFDAQRGVDPSSDHLRQPGVVSLEDLGQECDLAHRLRGFPLVPGHRRPHPGNRLVLDLGTQLP